MHKAGDALHRHKHQGTGKSAEQRAHEHEHGAGSSSPLLIVGHPANMVQITAATVTTIRKRSGHHTDRASKDRADFLTDREYDHASKNQRGAGIGFEE